MKRSTRTGSRRSSVSSCSPCRREEIAELLLLSPRHVGKLAERGVFERREGKFELVPTVQAYIRHLRKTSGFGESTASSAATHKVRLSKAKADLADIEARHAAGKYLPIELVSSTWLDGVIRVRQRLLAIPQRAAPELATETSPAVCSKILEMLIHEALNELTSCSAE
jgi:phage terminase Nu1 subunit (DNA packaging protein)